MFINILFMFYDDFIVWLFRSFKVCHRKCLLAYCLCFMTLSYGYSDHLG